MVVVVVVDAVAITFIASVGVAVLVTTIHATAFPLPILAHIQQMAQADCASSLRTLALPNPLGIASYVLLPIFVNWPIAMRCQSLPLLSLPWMPHEGLRVCRLLLFLLLLLLLRCSSGNKTQIIEPTFADIISMLVWKQATAAGCVRVGA